MTKTETLKEIIKLKESGKDSCRNFQIVQMAFSNGNPVPENILKDVGCSCVADYFHYVAPDYRIDKYEADLKAMEG